MILNMIFNVQRFNSPTITQLLTNMFAFWRRPCGVSIDHQAALSLLFQLLVAGVAPGTRNLRPFHQRFQAVACRNKGGKGEVSAWYLQFRQEGTWVTWMFALGRMIQNHTNPWLYHTFTFFSLESTCQTWEPGVPAGPAPQCATSKALVRFQIRHRSFRRPGAGPWVLLPAGGGHGHMPRLGLNLTYSRTDIRTHICVYI